MNFCHDNSSDNFDGDSKAASNLWQAASRKPPVDDYESKGIKQVDYTPEPAVCHLPHTLSPLPCDFHHHYYHYQSSAQYLWLAEAFVAVGSKVNADSAYGKAVFQDHFNKAALEGKHKIASCQPLVASMPFYDKHPVFDAEFCTSIGEPANTFTRLHDKAATAYLAGSYELALSFLHTQREHSNSLFLAGKCLFMLQEYKESIAEFSEAIRISHIAHDKYHIFASSQHLLRGKSFFSTGNIDLAISDFTKALDLYRHNKAASNARASAYRTKGNIKLAQEDEASF